MIHTKQKEKLMQILKCSEAEAIEIMTTDKRIDRGEKLFELDPEQKQERRKPDRQTANPPSASQERRSRMQTKKPS